MKISDKELRDMDDGGRSQRGDIASELLHLRREVRRLRRALRLYAYGVMPDNARKKLLDAALKPKRGGK